MPIPCRLMQQVSQISEKFLSGVQDSIIFITHHARSRYNPAYWHKKFSIFVDAHER